MSTVTLTIDGREVTVPKGTTIFDAARMHGIPIPTLCHQQNQTPVGVCRVCVVDVGARVYAAACIRECDPGMVVKTDVEPVQQARRTLVELLMADHPAPCARQQASGDCELETMAVQLGAGRNGGEPRFARRLSPRGRDDSSLSIAVDHEACILCDRCVRGCDEVKKNHVIGRTGRGYTAGIAFDLNAPMGSSTCVSCGECMVSCPTGALTNKRVIATELGGGERLDPDWILQLPVFKGVSGTFLELNRNAVVRRVYQPGDVICREGEFGSTAFYILEGTVDVFIGTPIAHVQQEDAHESWFSKIRSRLSTRREHTREEESTRRWIPIDAPVDLPYDEPIAQLGAGDLFGEMTCMSFHPRSATVRAHTTVVVLEMLRNVLDILQKNKTFRAELDRKYRQRALETHLKSVPVFAQMPADFIAYLRDRVELVRYSPGEVIVSQGEAADAFYLVRLGFVKVSESRPGGELVLTYTGRGGYFGEMGLLGGGVRTATVTALDHVDVVRITGEDFATMVQRFPDIRANLEQVAAERAAMNLQRARSAEATPINEFLSQGLMEAQSLLLLDLEKCTRCDQCVKACADAHDGVTRLVREGLRFDKYLVATSCRQCRDPLCMVGCPVGSIRRRNSLEIVIEDWCIGCGLCANNCPYGNLNMHPFEVQVPDPAQPSRKIAATQRKATGCDLCMEHAEPSCVYACPHDAAHRVEPLSFFASMRGPTTDRREPAAGTEVTSR
ncbi:MAG TPA: cyclic nucleotide-binding domain-containing protein [Vicinamibacterales bacterium]|nr:cyclic nucleotide-binding domain-containing protein [Vicinamibacterales bacterium]